MRVLGFGMASAVGRLGTPAGTQIEYVIKYNAALPYAIYTVLMLMDTVLIYFLSDTYSQPLQDFCGEDIDLNGGNIEM